MATLIPDARHHGGGYNRTFVRSPDGQVHRFSGSSIPGVAVVLGSSRTRNGQWSYTEYDVALAEGATSFDVLPGMHQQVFQHCGTWAEAYAYVTGLAQGPVTNFAAWLRAEYPRVATRLDETAAALEAIEGGSNADANLLEITVGPFVRRERYLASSALVLRAPDGSTSRIERGEHNAPSLESSWARIVDTQRLPGHGGGSEILTVACPEGTTWAFAAQAEG